MLPAFLMKDDWMSIYRTCERWCRAPHATLEDMLDNLYREPYGDIRITSHAKRVAHLSFLQYILVAEDPKSTDLLQEFLTRGLDGAMVLCTSEILGVMSEITGRNLLKGVDLTDPHPTFTPFYLIYLLTPSYSTFAELAKIYLNYREDSLFGSMGPMIRTMLYRGDTHSYQYLYHLYQDPKAIYFINNHLFLYINESIMQETRFISKRFEEMVPFLKIAYKESGFDYRIQMHHFFVANIKSRTNEILQVFYEGILGYQFEEDIEENVVVLFDLSAKYEERILKRNHTYLHQHLVRLCEKNPRMVIDLVSREYCYERYLPSVFWYELHTIFRGFLERKIRPDRPMEKNRQTFQDMCDILRHSKKLSLYWVLGEEVTRPSSFLPSVIDDALWVELHMYLFRAKLSTPVPPPPPNAHEEMILRWMELMQIRGLHRSIFQNKGILNIYIEEGYYHALRRVFESEGKIGFPLYHQLLFGIMQRNDIDPLGPSNKHTEFLDYLLDFPELRRYNLFNLLVQIPIAKYALLYDKPVVRVYIEEYLAQSPSPSYRLQKVTEKEKKSIAIIPTYFHCFFCQSHFDTRHNTTGYVCEECEYMAHDTCLFRIMSEVGSTETVKSCLMCRKRSMKRIKTTYEERKEAFYRFFLEKAF